MMRRSLFIFFIFSVLFSQGDQVITFSKDITPENYCGGFQAVKQTYDGGFIVACCVAVVGG